MKKLGILAALPLMLTTVTPTAAVAVDEALECRGMPATVVGQPGEPEADVSGTEGDDVIVSNGAWKVYGYGGNDTICITGGGYVQVWAEEGDDVVDASAQPASSSVTTALGDGDDTYLGHGGTDTVTTDPGPHSEEAGLGEDVVQTGGGRDIVESGTAGFPDEDMIDVGGGADFIKIKGTTARPITIAGGPGRDAVQWPWSTGPRQWTFDNRQGQVTRGGVVVAQVMGLEDFDLLSLSNQDLTFIGSDRAEAVRVTRYVGAQTGTIQAVLAGGDDQIWVNASQPLNLDGGSGRDAIDYRGSSSNEPPVTVDLRAGTVTRAGTVIAWGADFEDAVVQAPQRSRLVGTAGPNDLVLRTCQGRVDGLGGDDSLSTSIKRVTCNGGSVEGVQLFGGPGADGLVGGIYRDRLYGGPGSDTADGGLDRDLCRAERRTSCER